MTTGEFEYGAIMFGTEENMDDPVHEVYDVLLFLHCKSSILSLYSNKQSLKKLNFQFSLILEFTLSIRDFIC